jgi:predicted dehydrogenase
MTDPIRWGILGTGGIAGSFAAALRHVPDAELVAVGSRAQDSAERFAAEHAIPRGYGSYDDLVADDAVDVVYVATPHTRHAADMALALEAGKHVLGEKPFTISEAESARIADLAGARQRFAMEAFWSRFLPAYRTLRTLLDDEAIGEILRVDGSFGFRAEVQRAHRLFDPELGGGALLDLGCYPVQLAHFVLGPPTSVSAVARIGETGVDEDTIVAMGFADGAVAVAQSAIRTPLPCTATITGTAGTIDLPAFMHCPEYVDVTVGGETRRIDTPLGEAPLAFQVHEVHACLRAGQLESATMPLADTLAIAGTLDRARRAIGLRYPGEAEMED